jgi:hypothetical protein
VFVVVKSRQEMGRQGVKDKGERIRDKNRKPWSWSDKCRDRGREKQTTRHVLKDEGEGIKDKNRKDVSVFGKLP